jgi:hypothetical protein
MFRWLQVPLPHIRLGVSQRESVVEIKGSLCAQGASVTELQLAKLYRPEAEQPGVFTGQT